MDTSTHAGIHPSMRPYIITPGYAMDKRDFPTETHRASNGDSFLSFFFHLLLFSHLLLFFHLLLVCQKRIPREPMLRRTVEVEVRLSLPCRYLTVTLLLPTATASAGTPLVSLTSPYHRLTLTERYLTVTLPLLFGYLVCSNRNSDHRNIALPLATAHEFQ
jgi:hypothetical protein